MVLKNLKRVSLVACAAFMLFGVPVSAGNTDFKFILRGTEAKESLLGEEEKDDNEGIAYVTPNKDESNMIAVGALVNFSVRNMNGDIISTPKKCTEYRKYEIKYSPGKAVAGDSYKLYANVTKTEVFPVVVGGIWCP